MTESLSLDADVALWSVPPDERAGRPLLVLLHGYGADEHDLFALRPYLPEEFVVAAVRAPLPPPFPAPGWSWYPLDRPRGAEGGPIGQAAEALLAWLDGATDADRIGLLGFSQGAAVALQALRLRPREISFVVGLSGYVAAGDLDTDAELAALRPPVFWGRGSRDDVIPGDRIAHTAQWLPDHVDLSGRVYPGLTHSVSDEELRDVRAFLDKRLAAPVP